MKKQSITNYIVFYVFFLLVLRITGNTKITVKLENPKGSGNFIQKDIIEFIEDGERTLNETQPDQENVIMVMGLSGTGKSTIINYLCGVPLIGKNINGKWVIDLEFENASLPGGFQIFKIGHGTKSETLYPSFYTPPDSNFSYVDNPGFRDTRGIAIEIANGFFRKKVTSEVSKLKFLLLITHADINLRGQQFRDSMKGFSDFLGIFDEKDLRRVSRSIWIIVTRVLNYGTDEEIKKFLKKALLDIINEEIEDNHITKSEETVFREIIENNQMEIFSSPVTNERIRTKESNRILDLIEKMEYIGKDEVKIRVKVDKTYVPTLLIYIENEFKKFDQGRETTIDNSIDAFYRNEKRRLNNAQDAAYIYQKLSNLTRIITEPGNFSTFVNKIDDEILKKQDKYRLLSKKQVLDYFVELLPINNQKLFTLQTHWVGFNITSKLNNLMNELIMYVRDEHALFNEHLKATLENSFSLYFTRETIDANDTNQVRVIENSLLSNRMKVSKSDSFESFIENISDEILKQDNKIEIKNRKKQFDFFYKLMPNDSGNLNNKLNGTDIIQLMIMTKIEDLLNDLRKFYIESEPVYSENINSVTYKGYFGNISSIQSKINNDVKIKNLKTISIYTTNSFWFDNNFIMNSDKYYGNGPDLIVISPKIMIINSIKVNLSSNGLRGYPNETRKAKSGVQLGENGQNGKAGPPGYSGGNLLLVADSISNSTELKFISNGGQGGPGQEGGDGASGVSGQRGGKGGQAGCGGYGGYGGELISIVQNRENPNYYNIKRGYPGKEGEKGNHGIPGNAGLDGSVDLKLNCKYALRPLKSRILNTIFNIKQNEYTKFLSETSSKFTNIQFSNRINFLEFI